MTPVLLLASCVKPGLLLMLLCCITAVWHVVVALQVACSRVCSNRASASPGKYCSPSAQTRFHCSDLQVL